MKDRIFQAIKKIYIERQLLINNIMAFSILTALLTTVSGFIFTLYLQQTQSKYLDQISSMQLDKVRVFIDARFLEANRLTYKIENLSEFTPLNLKTNKFQSLQVISTLRNTGVGSINDIIIYYGDDKQFLTFNGYCSADVLNEKYKDFTALMTAIRSTDKPSFYNSEEFRFIKTQRHLLFMMPANKVDTKPLLICTYIFEEEAFWENAGISNNGDELVFIYDNQNKLVLSSDNHYNSIGKECAEKLGTILPQSDITVNGVTYSFLKEKGVNGITVLLPSKKRYFNAKRALI